MDVLQLPGDVPGAPRPHVGQSGVDSHTGGVGLGGGGQQDHRLGQRQLCLGEPQLKGVVHTGLHNGHRHGIGQTDILAGGAQNPPDSRDQVPCLQQAGQVVESGVRVGTPKGLHQGGSNVEMGVSLPVVAHGRLLCGSLRVLQGDK